MTESHDVFQTRVSLLTKKHRAMAHGYTASIGRDGLIVVQPKEPRRGVPLRVVVYLAVCFIVFKTVMLIVMGDSVYSDRVALLAGGTPVESTAAWAMQADPLTQTFANMVRALVP